MYLWVIWQNTTFHRKCTQNHKIEPISVWLTCIPEKGRGFVTVRVVIANLVSKDARDFKEKIHETARRDLLALRTYRAKRLGGRIPPRPPPPPAFLGLSRFNPILTGGGGGQFDPPPPVRNLRLPRNRHRSRHAFSWVFSFKSYASFDTKFAKIGPSVARSHDV